MSAGNSQNNVIAGALTFPRGEQNVQPVPLQPRQPRNLQGLLRFAMEATKAEDAPGNSEIGPMDEERRKFLEEALKNLTVDLAQVLRNSIEVLTNIEKIRSIQYGEPLPSDVQLAFNNLLDYIDDIDIANDFYKMGGFAVFPIAFGSDNDEVRAAASSVLAELCQNNPFCQSQALECGLLNILINLLQSERGNALAKCLYAVSCACRQFEPACRELIAQGGCDTLTQLLHAPELHVRTKAAFFVQYLLHNYNEAKEIFIKQNLVRVLTEQLKKGRDESSEHFLSALLKVVEDLDPRILAQCKDPSLNLRKVLEVHLKNPKLEDDTFSEEKEHCREVLLKVFDDSSVIDPVDEAADR